MDTELNIYQNLKRQIMLITQGAILASGFIATILHKLEPDPAPLSLIVPPILAIISLIIFLQFCRQTKNLDQLMQIIIILLLISLVGAISYFIWLANQSSDRGLVDIIPGPMTSWLFILPFIFLVLQTPRKLKKTVTIFWFVAPTPILIYLLLNPVELLTPRGMELIISLGPIMIAQIFAILFYSRVQQTVEKLYTKKIEYYTEIIERQTIKQQAIEQVFNQIHNGPLQNLAVLLRDLQLKPLLSQEIISRLTELNEEIRAVGNSLINTDIKQQKNRFSNNIIGKSEILYCEQNFRLGDGTVINLNLPLHKLFYEVYSLTLARKLPYFANIKVKVRNFDPYPGFNLNLESKRDLCLWLEEMLCNVGKHAKGVTRILVIGKYQEDFYALKVQDNGSELGLGSNSQGTNQALSLAKKLQGNFSRKSLTQGGVVCELSWHVK